MSVPRCKEYVNHYGEDDHKWRIHQTILNPLQYKARECVVCGLMQIEVTGNLWLDATQKEFEIRLAVIKKAEQFAKDEKESARRHINQVEIDRLENLKRIQRNEQR